MKILADHFTLANGVQIPKIGFGTWQIADGDDTYHAVSRALTTGYRHIDTARAYENEASVGRAVADSGLRRDQVFVTTKLPAEIKSYDGVCRSFDETMASLGMDFVDLYLIHAPWPWEEMGKDCAAGNAEVWRAMEEFYDQGRARAIGISNFEVADIEALVGSARIKPHVNQIKFYVGHTQDDITRYCQANGILVEGFAPLATGAVLDNDEIRSLAKTYGKSVAQLCIRYIVQKGVLPLPKTVTPSCMQENADVDFEIADNDMSYLDQLVNTAPLDPGPKKADTTI